MYNITYAMLVKNSKNPEIIREEMVKRYYELRNYSQVAKEFQTQSKRVKFWVQRFEKEGIEAIMYNITYAMLVKNSKNPEIIREEMVKRYYELRNYSQVAKEFQTQSKRVKF